MKPDHFLDAYFSNTGPGAALGWQRTRRRPKTCCRGMADLEASLPIGPSTPFELASASKMITATAVMRLIEDGKLRLDDPAGPLVGAPLAAAGARPVTVRDLLQHTSGLPDYLEQGGFTPPEEMTRTFVIGKLGDWFGQAVPGRAHAYSNTNYVVLASIVETVTAQSFSTFLATFLFGPLGMAHSGTVGSLDPRSPPLAVGYRNLGFGLSQIDRAPTSDIDTEGDGGLFSCVNDLLVWQAAFWTGQVIRPETIELMIEPGTTDDGQRFAYGLGLQIEQSPGLGRWYGHSGSWFNSTTLIGHYPDAALSVVVLSNEAMAPVERISQRAIATIAAR